MGGSTALRFESGTVTVVWATPNAGFTVSTEGSGTAEARVRFRSDGHRSEVHGSYEDGHIDVDIEEDDEDHSGSDDGSDDD